MSALLLDHIVIAVDDLDVAIRDYQSLGFTCLRGGVHAAGTTHNALILFDDGTYLELLAATGDPPRPGVMDFSDLVMHGEGLAGFALRSDDLEADAVRLRGQGLAVGEVIPGERRRADGTLVRWKLALLDEGFAPFLIQDITPRDLRVPSDPSVTAHANQAVGLRGVVIAAHDLIAARRQYAALLALSPDTSDLASGPIVLREMEPGAEMLSGLYAIQLVCERITGSFPLEQAHGVRFEPVG